MRRVPLGGRHQWHRTDTAITWDTKTLDAYLAKPQKVVPGNQMPFSALADARQRADVVACLET
jgi:cytochrome c